jgi:hypothetical protein
VPFGGLVRLVLVSSPPFSFLHQPHATRMVPRLLPMFRNKTPFLAAVFKVLDCRFKASSHPIASIIIRGTARAINLTDRYFLRLARCPTFLSSRGGTKGAKTRDTGTQSSASHRRSQKAPACTCLHLLALAKMDAQLSSILCRPCAAAKPPLARQACHALSAECRTVAIRSRFSPSQDFLIVKIIIDSFFTFQRGS